MKRLLMVMTVASLVTPWSLAQETRPEQRQENRENRQENRQEARQEAQENRNQEARQENRQEARQDRREARQERIQQRRDNRSQYYGNDIWSQLDPWIKRNNLTPLERLGRAADSVTEVTEKALNSANKIADRAGEQTQARYGFNNPNGPGEHGWFYDYYTYSPTYYNAPATGTTVYGSATRYYDLNNDGVYESLNVFRDSDSNASYDTYDQYDFGGLEESATASKPSAEELVDSPEDANRHRVAGKVFASKPAKVNGNQHLIVRLSEANSQTKDASIVDIGPADMWKERPLQVNDMLTATGPIERIGNKRILIAETVQVGDGKEQTVSRSAPKMQGQVVDVTTTEVKGKPHTIAVIESESKRQMVDLGPTDNLKVKVEPKTEIVVQGVPVQVRQHSIVQAEQVVIDGQSISIRRW